MSDSASKRHNKAILLSAIVVMAFTAIAVAGSYWWHERNELSQASKADCVLAQKIVAEGQELPSDKAAVEAWEQSTRQLRRSQMKDGYLGNTIAQYESWAAVKATGESSPEGDKQVKNLADKANGHCSDAQVTLEFPKLAS